MFSCQMLIIIYYQVPSFESQADIFMSLDEDVFDEPLAESNTER